MAKTKIEWTKNADGSQGESWNPLRCREINGNINRSKSGHFGTGCTMVSEGCLNCYAGSMNYRFYGNGYGYHSKPTEFFLDDDILNRPLRARKPTTFFVCSMTDLFHENVHPARIEDILQVMCDCPQHTFQVLTKRPQEMLLNLQVFYANREIPPMPNVWLGTTAENQEQANIRIPKLLEIPAAIHWVSCEPLLGAVNLARVDADRGGHAEACMINSLTGKHTDMGRPCKPFSRLDWVVVGGESGSNARPMNPHWALSLRDQCVAAGVPFFFKQWGAFRPVEVGDNPDKVTSKHYRDGGPQSHAGLEEKLVSEFSGVRLIKVGKKAAGRILDGRIWDEMPEVKR